MKLSSVFVFLFAIGVTTAAFAQSDSGAATSGTHAFSQFLRTYCVKCHGPEKQESELRLDTLAADFSDPLITSKWAEVLNSVNGHEMPPEDEKQPTANDAAKFAQWLETSLAEGEIAKRTARVVLRRMNRAEYNNTIRDLVGVDFDPAEAFPEDPPAGGFDNIGTGAHNVAAANGTLLFRGANDPRSRIG